MLPRQNLVKSVKKLKYYKDGIEKKLTTVFEVRILFKNGSCGILNISLKIWTERGIKFEHENICMVLFLPLGGWMSLVEENIPLFLIGKINVSLNSWIVSSNPAISLHVTVKTDGSTSCDAIVNSYSFN